jgi:hypothetical protein
MSKSSVLSTKPGFSKARLLTLKCSRTFIGETRDGADHLASHQLDEVIAKVKDSLIEVWAIRLPQGLGPENATRECRSRAWPSECDPSMSHRTSGGTALQPPPANSSHAGCIRGCVACVEEVAEIIRLRQMCDCI